MDYNISYRKKDKGIQLIISYKDEFGKWKQKTKQGYATIKEAKKDVKVLVEALEEEQKNKIVRGYDSITFKEYSELYLNDIGLHLSHNTRDIIFKAINRFSSIHDMNMKDITFSDIQEGVNQMMNDGYKYNSIYSYYSMIRTMFNRAIKLYKILSDSPCQGVILPIKEAESKVKALTKDELDRFMNVIFPEKDYLICLLAVSCGLRAGEIMGLTLSDIDFKNRTININKQWKAYKKDNKGINVYDFGKLKSKNSNRVVPLPEQTAKVLKKYISENPIQINGRIFNDTMTERVTGRMNTKIKKLGFDFSIHSLRHTYTTLLIANGVDFKTIAKLIGDTVEMVMKVYSHVTDDMFDSASKKIDVIFK